MIYNEIYNFCSVRNNGNCFKNGETPTPRVEFLMKLLEFEGIEYELDIFETNSRWQSDDSRVNKYFNIILRGSSTKMVVAHHDVNNHRTDNANDNSASVINAIATKKLKPDVHVVLLDGEEFGGIGSNRLSKQIKSGEFGSIEWVLNYELTGKGGKYFFIGDYPGRLSDHITALFNCPIVNTPFNDSVILRKHGIDSVVINPIPPLPDNKKSTVQAPDGKYLDISMLYNCHTPRDTVSTISPIDMKEFVEEIALKIIG